MSTSLTAFNYAELQSDHAATLRATATRIRDRMMSSVVDTGHDLLSAKNMLEHGAFGSWLTAEFGMTERTARNYMSAAELAAKSEIVSVLPPTALYRLASPSTPEAARTDIVERLEKGESMSAKDIAGQIAEARDAEAEAKRLAKIPPAKLKRMRISKEQRERKWEADRLERQKRDEAEMDAAHRAIGILRDRLAGDQFKEFAELVLQSRWRFRDELRRAVGMLAPFERPLPLEEPER